MNRSQCDQLVASLLRYRAHASAEQCTQVDRITEFIHSCDAPWRRSTSQGHITASAWIVDTAHENALLIHHKKLDKWLQPGGHVDDEDATFLDAALREAREETGIASFEMLRNGASSIYDVDVHEIPARNKSPIEPAHFHYDIRFRLIANSTTTTFNADESNDLRWLPLSQISCDDTFDESVRRMATTSS
jgi:8-oxo-dGTP pyrophosphatase MutT (NUDIX family)